MPQNLVSVIIRCKQAKTEAVENVRELLALRSDEERATVLTVGVSDRPFRVTTRVYI